jgi:hypothetical protein
MFSVQSVDILKLKVPDEGGNYQAQQSCTGNDHAAEQAHKLPVMRDNGGEFIYSLHFLPPYRPSNMYNDLKLNWFRLSISRYIIYLISIDVNQAAV